VHTTASKALNATRGAVKMLARKIQLPVQASSPIPQRLIVADGTVEALKWLALVLMTLDHVNKYLFDQKLPGLFELGRVAMPLFGFVLAYNLARPNALERGLFGRMMRRLALFGVLATPFFLSLGKLVAGWWPLNILFMLLTATAVIYFLHRGGILSFLVAAIVFLIGGALVEFGWFGVIFCITSWMYCAKPSKISIALLMAAAAMLYMVNRNFWAMTATLIILTAPHLELTMPRIRYAFYAYYPAHLAVLAAIVFINR
jgi:hypothetical protein